jgi:type IV pilus assembly protein PilQ
VTKNNNILLDIEVRKDSPNYEYVAITGNNEPAINTRNVKSRVMIRAGDTVVIGGIYEKEKSKSQSGVPILSRIPLLGWLFKNEQVQVSKNKLLIFITPVLVNSQGNVER